jgi:predicted secreted protein
MKSIYVSVLAPAFTLVSSAFAQDALVLKLNLQPGTSYAYTMEMNQTNVQTVEGEEQKLDQEIHMAWDYDVLETGRDGVMVVKLTYRRVKINQNYGHEKSEYDSDNPPDFVDPSMRGLASLPGSELVVRLTPEGEVVGIQGVEKMLDKMIAALDLPDSPQKDQVVANLRKQFGSEAVEQSLEQITAFYPGKPVSVGDLWKKTSEMSTGFPMDIISDYTLKSRRDGLAVIDVTSELSSDPQNALAMGPLTMAYDVDGAQTGTITADESSGLPARSEMNLQFSGHVNVSGVPNEEPQSWPISATGSVLVTFEKQPR